MLSPSSSNLRLSSGALISSVVSLLAITLTLSSATSPTVATAQSAAACGLAQAAFCETFDQPSPNGAGTRSGDLDGVVWGVSRISQAQNVSQNANDYWAASTESICDSSTPVAPERDVRVCNGQAVDTVNDGGGVAILAMYPRQPFDIAGRTGTVVFDVSDDSANPHAAWPTFMFTDQPVPAPSNEIGLLPSVTDSPRNALGVSFANQCGSNGVDVDQIWTISNFVASGNSVHHDGCATKGSLGHNNHVEIQISESHVWVYMSDPDNPASRRLIDDAAVTMPLTRGLTWIEDAHYNACKSSTQCIHAFSWDNYGFDGPVLPRDLGFDILDATQDGTSSGSLGWGVPNSGQTFQFRNVHDIENASAALLEFTWNTGGAAASISYSFNGQPAHTQAWPYPSGFSTFDSQTLAIPVPLSELVDGTNSLTLAPSNGRTTFANFDLILVGAGGLPAGSTSSTSTATPSPTATATLLATRSPVATSTATSTSTATNTHVATSTVTATAVPSIPPSSTVLLGNQTIQGTVDSSAAGQSESFPFTAVASGSAKAAHIYIDSGNTATSVVLGVYDDAKGNPDKLLTQASLNNPTAGAWNQISISAISITRGQRYWIALLQPARTAGTIRWRDGHNFPNSVSSVQTNLRTLASTATHGQIWADSPLSAYLTMN